ncbi:MAG TPA: response regulator [Polyangiaceae bacterium]|jgi:signal transduction histidine kinase/DNA-binding response OmpR family regulator|nr:response regulator [Polyangiaceae bacterium]
MVLDPPPDSLLQLTPHSVLLVDDSAYWTDTIGEGLRREGYIVSVLHDGLAAVERLRKDPPQILVTDYFLANLDGGKLCQIAKHLRVNPSITTVILTGGADRNLWRAPSAYADAVIAKNSMDVVLADLGRALGSLKESLPPPGSIRHVIGHERLAPRAIASKLHGLKQYLDALHEGIGDAVIGADSELRVYFMNSTAVEMFELREDEALAKPIYDVLSIPRDHPLVELIRKATAEEGKPGPPITTEIGENTLRITVAGLRSPDGSATALLIARDISDIKAAEQDRLAVNARLHEADKMASLGHLIAGVSHEVNNPLAAILLNLETLAGTTEDLKRSLKGVSDPALPPALEVLDETGRILKESSEAAQRIRSIVAEMGLFAQPSTGTGENVSIEEVLEGALLLVANEARFKATVIREFKETPGIIVDRVRLGQAFLNILLNAAQAISGMDPATNWIRVATWPDRGGVKIEIQNNGPPIPEEVLPKIFEPFFTTKAFGQGHGLGLSITYETVRRHGGFIEVESRPGVPTTFRVWLPSDTGLGLVPRATLVKERSRTLPATLLLVDDDRLVRNGLRRILEKFHDVVVASGGEQALDALAERTFDLVLCDLIMPTMTGMELFAAVAKKKPEQAKRFVFLTGGTSSPEARDFLLEVKNPRAYKPIGAEQLIRLVDDCVKQFAKQ